MQLSFLIGTVVLPVYGGEGSCSCGRPPVMSLVVVLTVVAVVLAIVVLPKP